MTSKLLLSKWRRNFKLYLAFVFIVTLLAGIIFSKLSLTMAADSRLDPRTQPKFINSLPSPARIDATKGGHFDVEMRETKQWLGLYSSPGADGIYGTGDDARLNTTVWGYGLKGQKAVTYPGSTFVARKDVPIEVLWDNKLPKTGHIFPVDKSIITKSLENALQKGLVPTVTHVHGGHTEWTSDGYSEAWFTQDFSQTGPSWVKKNYSYANDNRRAATLWYHDHILSNNRLSVYAGLAGFYLLRDNNEINLINRNILPSGNHEKELIIQDRDFTAKGQLYYPPGSNYPDTLYPSVVPNFYGDFILVNGMAWPKLAVEPRKYRLRLANGSNSRFYNLNFNDSKEKFYEIGTEQGLLEKPVVLENLVLAPGERADVIVDFTGDSGKEFIIRNFDDKADSELTGQIMKIAVEQPLSNVPNATVDTNESDGLTTRLLPDKIIPPAQTGLTRQLVLFENKDEFGRKLLEQGTLADGSLRYDEPTTEKPKLGTTEVWELYNTTQEPHPIHLHLVSFLILNRQNFAGSAVPIIKDPRKTKLFLQNAGLIGNPEPPPLYEKGWKDTVVVNPGEVVRIIATFDKPGYYLWHCHILEHEDFDMMRPFQVVATP
ncbi:multicopper oxidase domain-containing protein [Nostoc sp. UHCC 0926]|uniref:multicopper oxidase family protein n=1 Tax=unclassified Nostoc TaxID=2593658 RepID=UPI00235DD16A|nr:multicopper oxidase domain-containing protein [Nostoc sp. UHCC 0926]WDD32382.1 multicopper oxidase domain-containing protein [Nostoc sp. UHCC 0926]